MRAKLREWLRCADFTHHVTLATNAGAFKPEKMRQKLKDRDARVNRRLCGKRYRKKPDERILWIAFPEKLDVNAHWHLLLNVLPEQLEALDERPDREPFDQELGRAWCSIVPSGSVSVQPIRSAPAVVDYVTKRCRLEVNCITFVLAHEFHN
jgi:hypothetical protein